jgi:hypothetical protein
MQDSKQRINDCFKFHKRDSIKKVYCYGHDRDSQEGEIRECVAFMKSIELIHASFMDKLLESGMNISGDEHTTGWR